MIKELKNKLQKKNACFKCRKTEHYPKAYCQRKLRTELITQNSEIKILAAAFMKQNRIWNNPH